MNDQSRSTKIYFFSPYDVLRARTNPISDVRFCAGFAENGCSISLITPYIYRPDNMRLSDVPDSYGITKHLKVALLPTPFWDNVPKWLVLPIMLFFNTIVVLGIYLVNLRQLSSVTIMSRSADLLLPAILLKRLIRRGPKIIVWAHEVIFKKRYFWVYRNSDAAIATNSAITQDLHSEAGIASDKLAITLNPITEKQLRNVITRAAARDHLGITGESPLIVYTGKLYKGQREVEYILEAAGQLPNYRFLLTGGKPDIVDYYKDYCLENELTNVEFTGFLQRYEDVAYYQFAADALVTYYSSHDHLIKYNLPNKICEYMLTSNPIVSSDHAAIRDVLTENNCILIQAEDPHALRKGIMFAIEEKEKAEQLAKQAFVDVKEMTFYKRTGCLLDFFDTL